MRSIRRVGGCLLAAGLAFSTSAGATLISRAGGTLVYDTDLDITWLADANLALTMGFTGAGVDPASGRMSWDAAMAWADGLVFGGLDDWRLPVTLQPDLSCSSQVGGVSSGFGCTGSEMGHLFNVEGISLASPGPFFSIGDVTPFFYWSATEFAPNPASSAWGFAFNGGGQAPNGKGSQIFAWAVRDGDVPEPSSLLLALAGVAGLAWRRRLWRSASGRR